MLTLCFFAYIDPVSGSLLLQAIFAGVIGCLAVFRRSIWAITSRILGRKRSEK
jgi:hypothetical protein